MPAAMSPRINVSASGHRLLPVATADANHIRCLLLLAAMLDMKSEKASVWTGSPCATGGIAYEVVN